MLNESHGVHNAQEYENRFWTIFAVLFSTALFFAADSPIAIGSWNPSLGFISVLLAGYAMHVWDRNTHRLEVGRLVRLKRGTATSSLNKLQELGIPIEEQLKQLDECLKDIDQTFIPSTINNFINRAYVIRKEQEIISIFEEAEPSSLNYLICNSQLPLIFYKIKDHHSFKHHHRSQIIELLSIERIAHLNVVSRVVVLHALQIMKLPANMKAEHCVRNIILSTYQDDLSELKTLSDAKGDYYSFVKLVFDDIKSDIVRDEILKHIRTQANVQNQHMLFKTKRSRDRKRKFWRKVLSDVDDTLSCSGGSYPSGIDKRYGKKVIYPGVLGFYRELDLGVDGPLEWPSHTAGNLVFLSARPHVYKDVSEKINYAKFEKLKERGMHTTPSLLAGDINSGLETVFKNDFEPLAQKKYRNFKQYVTIYPEFRHVFVCDNGQGDLRAAELMVDAYPKEIEAIYVHEVQPRSKTYKYNPEFWRDKPVKPIFFRTYIEAALDAAKRNLLQVEGLRRICVDAINDFYLIQTKNWPSQKHKWDRFDELNQSLYHANIFLQSIGVEGVPLLEAERLWKDNQKVRTPYGIGTIVGFDPQQDLYDVILDWRPLVMQVQDAVANEENRTEKLSYAMTKSTKEISQTSQKKLETVFEVEEEVVQITGQNTSQTNEDSRVRSSKDASTSPSTAVLNSDIVSLECIPALEDEVIEWEKKHVITAKIKCRQISKYTPPSLPILPNEGKKSSFSFWTSSTKVNPKPLFSKNDKCTTPYGCGAVLEYRADTGIVVISITGWRATCYLQANIVKPVTEGFFNNLLRMISTESKASLQAKMRESDPLYSVDTILSTPFGRARMIHPIKEKQAITASTHNIPGARLDSIAVSLIDWTLSNGTSPILYTSTQSMISWQTRNNKDDKSMPDTSFLSAFGSIAQGVKNLMAGKAEKTSNASTSGRVLFDQYYTDGATVVTPFGDGIVEEFRAVDGVYRISLLKWELCNGESAKIFSKQESLRPKIATGCKEGDPVVTSLGLTGNLVSVQAKSGLHIVAVPSTHMICYLQAVDVLRPVKAVVLDTVTTPFGEGTVVKYRSADDIYEIQLKWNARLFANSELFQREKMTKEEEKGGFSWVFRFLFSDNRMKISKDSVRSRSNSIV